LTDHNPEVARQRQYLRVIHVSKASICEAKLQS
jgi:hypothetical protein